MGSQARRLSNSAPAQPAEKYDDRHVRYEIEGISRSRGETAETVHHLYIAHLKGDETATMYEEYRARYQECVRMLNGMERALGAAAAGIGSPLAPTLRAGPCRGFWHLSSQIP